MADCRDLIRLDTIVCILCGTAALLLTACGLWRRDGRRDFLRGAVYGMLGTAGVVLIFGIWAAVNFNGLFVTFHKVAFRNDGWLLNPKTDHIILRAPGTSRPAAVRGGTGGHGGCGMDRTKESGYEGPVRFFALPG